MATNPLWRHWTTLQCFFLLAVIMVQGLQVVESFLVAKTTTTCPLDHVAVAADPSLSREARRCTCRAIVTFSLSSSSSSAREEKRHSTVIPRNRQLRRKPTDRRPKYYWLDPANLKQELTEFWVQQAGVNLAHPDKPPIPNNVLLIHFRRHDLQAAIAKNGGRNVVSEKLGGLPIVAGRWQEAVEQSPEMAQLVQYHPNMTADRPPPVCTARTPPELQQFRNNTLNNSKQRWTHRNGRKPKGYWSLQRLVQELYVVCIFLYLYASDL